MRGTTLLWMLLAEATPAALLSDWWSRESMSGTVLDRTGPVMSKRFLNEN